MMISRKLYLFDSFVLSFLRKQESRSGLPSQNSKNRYKIAIKKGVQGFILSLALSATFLLSSCSNTDFKIFDTPHSPVLSVAGTTVSSVTLSWSPASLDAYPNDTYTYTVAMANTSGSESFTIPLTNCVGMNVTSCTVSNLSSGGQYFFKVQATDTNYNNFNPVSNEVNATSMFVENTYSVGNSPSGIAIDASGNVWVTNINALTELSSSGTTIGTYPIGGTGGGIAIDSSGDVWTGVMNSGNISVIKISSSGTIIGTYPLTGGGDIWGVALDMSSNVWVANGINNNVTKISSFGTIIGTYSLRTKPEGIAIDTSGNVWVTVTYSNDVTKLNSSGITIGTYSVGNGPEGIAIDQSGNVWVANTFSGTVSELSSTGSTIGTYTLKSGLRVLVIDASGNVWVTNDNQNNVTELSPSGAIMGTYPVGLSPVGITIDASGNVWVANQGDNTVTKIVGVAKGPQYYPYTGPIFPGGNI